MGVPGLNWLGRKVAFPLAAGLTIFALWNIPPLRAGIEVFTRPVAGLVGKQFPWGVSHVAEAVTSIALLVVAGLILAAVLSSLLRNLPATFSVLKKITLEGLRYAALICSSSINVVLALYLVSVFWEGSFFGTKLLPGDSPESVRFATGLWILNVMSFYLVVQCLPLFFRPRMSVGWTITDFVTSSVPAVVLIVAWGNFWFNSPSYEWWTPYRQGWLETWPCFIVDLANIAVSMRLLTRGFLSSDEIIRTGGHHPM